MKKITRLGYHDENGNPQEVVLGKWGVGEIKEHQALGEGDRWYYEIIFKDGTGRMVFDPKIVDYEDISLPNKEEGGK